MFFDCGSGFPMFVFCRVFPVGGFGVLVASVGGFGWLCNIWF